MMACVGRKSTDGSVVTRISTSADMPGLSFFCFPEKYIQTSAVLVSSLPPVTMGEMRFTWPRKASPGKASTVMDTS